MFVFVCMSLSSCRSNVIISEVGDGWSSNSINTVKFRKNAITTFNKHQFIAYYDAHGYVVLGKRKLDSNIWETYKTQYKGNTKDAHNSVSIAVDGDGFLHVSWDHHNTKLRYAKSKKPLSLGLGEELIMTGEQEDRVTYPEFYNLPNGNLLFFYRSGESGRGNLVINSYDISSKKWTQLQNNLIDGEDKRSAYWQACIDRTGVIHLSWVWRETWGVETNHDLAYARSKDAGVTWEKSTGEKYNLPITLASAEYAWKIPQNTNLINQTSITADDFGKPYIVNYWNDENKIPQFQIVYLGQGVWKRLNTAFRKTSFVLGGGGTKRIPISRPSILVSDVKDDKLVSIVFRDEERQNRVSLAYASLKNELWNVIDLTDDSVGQWEPNYDILLWNSKKELNIFLQNVTQVDGEGLAENESSKVRVLSIKNINKLTNLE
ncbi:BNR repeat-containing protein [Tamlana flava]|uniref:BNR repeat-containing protein n=1 Tax=Tamlana flava TaxID=3158572 RepID=UPI00351AF73A